jgi:transposase
MARVNKCANRSKVSEAKLRQFLELFSFFLNASQIALGTGLNRNTVNRYLMALRQRIAEYCERQAPVLEEIKVSWWI